MNPITFALRRPVTVMVAMVALLAGGALAYSRMKVDIFPPLNLPVIKLTATNRVQQVQAFLMDLDEAGGIVEPLDAPGGTERFLEYMTSASSRIAGGADEVLRNQLAERALGMPGDIRADKDVPFSQLPA